ncbi:hypothetical protein Ciccas_006025 [Cichlidogyrus casuarinus]|uniref:CFA20 domain-containing protein n=1 Tax=Cichlidogyrus casuarinus TaxID=1844966 RepID=A0ABD2Q6Y7_9PLAT
MFKFSYQKKFFTVLLASGGNPFKIWCPSCMNQDGSITRMMDEDLNCLVLQLVNQSISSGYITAPKMRNDTLGIRLPVFVVQVKSIANGFMFTLEVKTHKNMKKFLRATTCVSKVEMENNKAIIPLILKPGWNTVVLDLDKVCRVCYKDPYMTTERITINANCRIRRCFFSDRIYEDDELPKDYKLSLESCK